MTAFSDDAARLRYGLFFYPAAPDADKNERGKTKNGKANKYGSDIHAVPPFL